MTADTKSEPLTDERLREAVAYFRNSTGPKERWEHLDTIEAALAELAELRKVSRKRDLTKRVEELRAVCLEEEGIAPLNETAAKQMLSFWNLICSVEPSLFANFGGQLKMVWRKDGENFTIEFNGDKQPYAFMHSTTPTREGDRT
jgi:hypothetical protein